MGCVLSCAPLKSSTFAHSRPVERLFGILGLTPKYRLGLYGPHSRDSFESFAFLERTVWSLAARTGKKATKETRRSAGLHHDAVTKFGAILIGRRGLKPRKGWNSHRQRSVRNCHGLGLKTIFAGVGGGKDPSPPFHRIFTPRSSLA